MVSKVWAHAAIGGLAMGMLGCSSAAPTGTQAPENAVNPTRAVQATETTLNPDALRAALPESIPASEAKQRLVKIDPSQIAGLAPQAKNSAGRNIQQLGWGGRWGGRGWGGGRLGGLGWGGSRWGGLGGWGGLGWGGGWSGYGLRSGWGDLGYFPYVSLYYPVGSHYYPYYQHGSNYHPFYTSAGTFYSMPGLQVSPSGLYNTYSYNWY